MSLLTSRGQFAQILALGRNIDIDHAEQLVVVHFGRSVDHPILATFSSMVGLLLFGACRGICLKSSIVIEAIWRLVYCTVRK